MLRDLFGFDSLTNIDLALIGQQSENEYNGVNCGIMDQFAVAMGKKDYAIFLDTSDLSYTYAPIKLDHARREGWAIPNTTSAGQSARPHWQNYRKWWTLRAWAT